MDPKSFISKDAGEIRKAATGYWTFIPRPLPPKIEYTAELTLLLS